MIPRRPAHPEVGFLVVVAALALAGRHERHRVTADVNQQRAV